MIRNPPIGHGLAGSLSLALPEEGVYDMGIPKAQVAENVFLNVELTPLARGDIFHLPIAEDTFPQLVSAYIILNELAKKIEKRMETVKPTLHAAAQAYGTKNEKGGHLLSVGRNEVLRERRASEMPNAEKLKTLLETRGIDVLDCFDIEKVVTLNASKLKLLIDLGKLNQKEVSDLCDENFAIKATPGPELKSALASLFKKPEDKSKPKAAKKTRIRK